MKMTQLHYNTLKNYIKEMVDGLGDELSIYVKNMRKLNTNRDVEKIIRWNLYHGVRLDKQTELTKQLYEYLNDNHIDTALKRIMTELGV